MNTSGRKPPRARRPCFSIALASGKGGVGKTTIAANLAMALAGFGTRVTLVDGDLSLANLDVLLGVIPERTIEHWFFGDATLDEIVVEGPRGVRVVAAGSGLQELTQLPEAAFDRLFDSLACLEDPSDVLIFDNAAGIGTQVSEIAARSSRALLVTWPEPAALVDAYAALKVLARRKPELPVGLLVNGARSEQEARRVHHRLSTASERFLGRRLGLDGWVPDDRAVREAAIDQRPVLLAEPMAPSSRQIELLATHFLHYVGRPWGAAVGERWSERTRTGEIVH
ncbi:MAG: MinD/ParA family protein [Acidobacteriota bacterium]